MNFKILKRSLKSKKSINFILLVFIMLAAMFIAGSVNNLILITGGVETYFDLAGIDDYIILSNMGGSRENPLESDKQIEEFLNGNKYVDNYTVDDTVYAGGSQIEKADGTEFNLNSPVMITSYNIKQQKLFDDNNNQITNVEDGTIYLTLREYEDNDISIGDKLYFVMSDGTRKEFTVAGISKDALLGADMMGTHRFLVSVNDMEELFSDKAYLYSRLYSIELNDTEAFKEDYSNEEISVLFGDTRQTIKITYVMDMVIAAVFIVASILLVIISVVILRFTIVFTVNEDYKEIGIMKAIGIGDTGIRRLYIVKYMIIAIIGAMLGFVGSIPFSKELMKPALRNMVVENSGNNVVLQLIISALVAFVVILFAYISTGKIKKFTPMDAIRSGNNGERFKKKGIIKLNKTGKNPTTFMAINDVLSEMKKYIILLVATMVGVWMVVMPINTINTLNSDNIVEWFAMQKSDMVISSDAEFYDIVSKGTKQAMYDCINKYEKILEDNGYEVTAAFMEIGTNGAKVTYGDKSTKTTVFQGFGSDIAGYKYTKGQAPKYENEIAITHVVADRLGVGIGDTVYINIGGEDRPFVITAFFQSMNNMGEGIRVNEEVDLDYQQLNYAMGVQFDFSDKYSDEDKEKAIEEISELLPECGVYSGKGIAKAYLGDISERLIPIKYAMLAVVIIVNILIVMLMQKMFLIRERGEMAMLKSVGFSNGKIISWQTKRIAMILFLGVVIGTITGTPFSQLTSGEVFKMMGASKIVFDINYLEVYVIYPLAIFVASVLMCMVIMLSVRKITVNDMNEIE